MKKIQILTILLVLFSLALSILANNDSQHSDAARFAANQRRDDESFKWQINIKVSDDVGIDAEKFKEELKKAFEKEGDTLDEIASPDSTSLYVVIGKDDGDDNNDGEPDDQDTDKYGNGFPDADETVEIHNLDEEFPNGLNSYPDDNNNAGVFISIMDEYGNNSVYITKRDSLEPKATAQAIVKTRNDLAVFIPASFSFGAETIDCMKRWEPVDKCMAREIKKQREREEARQKKEKQDEAALASKNWTTLMTSGKTLTKGTKITDPKSGSYFIYQEDGNVVLYNSSGTSIWASGSWIFENKRAGNVLEMQPDGNLVAVSTNGLADWVSGTKDNPGAYLQVEWKLLSLRIVDKTGKNIKIL